jgi:putative heme-binding domain-containing protein
VLKNILASNSDVTRRLRALWTLHVINGIRSDELLRLMNDSDEHIRSWAIQLDLERGVVSPATVEQLAKMARDDSSQLVRLYVASALQSLPLDQRWTIAEGLAAHAEDADDHNLPLMIWYGVEPLVPADARRAVQLAYASKIPTVWKFIIRRAAAQDDTMPEALTTLYHANDVQRHLILDEILVSLEGRVGVTMPGPWTPVYNSLLKSDNASIREKADLVALAFGDRRILPRMRDVLSDGSASLESRQRALDILVAGNDRDAAPALIAALDQAELRSKAIKALGAYDDPNTPTELLRRYESLTDQEKQDAINTLASRSSYVTALLDAIEAEKVNRKDVHAYTIRQLQGFKDASIVERLQKVWGTIRETSADKKARIAELRNELEGQLADADLSHGRAVFNKTCSTCHTLFGYGEKIGPDITGSNRANLDYILENAIDPSAVVGKDYQMTALILDDGRGITGLIQKETDSAITIRTFNDSLVIAKSAIEIRALSPLSLMPEGQFDQLSKEELRDLIAYLASPSQVALPKIPAPIDLQTGRVPDAMEGETMKLVGKTQGNAASQPMGAFNADRWSGNDHLWWTGAEPGARLELELPVEADGTYNVEVVMTMARDYGIVQLSIDGNKLGGPIDLFNSPEVQTTGVITFENITLAAGPRHLEIEITGANPNATSHMFGLDYVRLLKQ